MQATILRHITPRSGTSSAIRDSPGVESPVAAEGRTRALQHLHRLGDDEDVRSREDALERRAFDQRRRVILGVQADVGPVSQEREPLARLGLKGVDLLRGVSRAHIEGPAAREVEPRVPGDALPHGTEVERLHGLSPQPLVTAGARRPVAVLLNRCHGVVLPTVRFYQQATPGPRAGPADSGHVTTVFRREDGRGRRAIITTEHAATWTPLPPRCPLPSPSERPRLPPTWVPDSTAWPWRSTSGTP